MATLCIFTVLHIVSCSFSVVLRERKFHIDILINAYQGVGSMTGHAENQTIFGDAGSDELLLEVLQSCVEIVNIAPY
jgi:hypothetical protein